MLPGDAYALRLVCHPRLPLIAGLDSSRPAVHVWEFGPAGLRRAGVLGADTQRYPDEPWKRYRLIPAVAWHPREPLLLVTSESGLRQWSPGGLTPPAGAVAGAAYRSVAFSPDGSTVWASPSSQGDEGTAWLSSDTFDPTTGELRRGPRWDTAVVEHPGGGLVVTLSSDQGATDLLFARPDGDHPVGLRVLRNAIILDVDYYVAPIFSDDGRYLAVRGNAYVQSLDVFEFPSLRKVLHTALGDPYPGYPYPPEWLAEQATWSHHNIAFTAPGTLLVGTPKGTLIEIDLDSEQAVERQVCDGEISALATLPTGELVLADRAGRLTVMPTPAPGPHHPAATEIGAHDRVAEFLAGTAELPADADLSDALVRTDGVRVWNSGDLDTVTEADDLDPTWLRLQAAINVLRDPAPQ
jgi:hypothetical protein